MPNHASEVMCSVRPGSDFHSSYPNCQIFGMKMPQKPWLENNWTSVAPNNMPVSDQL